MVFIEIYFYLLRKTVFECKLTTNPFCFRSRFSASTRSFTRTSRRHCTKPKGSSLFLFFCRWVSLMSRRSLSPFLSGVAVARTLRIVIELFFYFFVFLRPINATINTQSTGVKRAKRRFAEKENIADDPGE